MSKCNFTVAEIKSKYNEKIARDRREAIDLENRNLWGHYVLRTLSYHPSWLFLKLGISANGVTLIAFIIGLIGCVLLALGNYVGIIIGALLLNIWALLDYVDGHVARCSGSSSGYGRFVDSVNDHVICCLLFICASICAFLSFDIHPDPLSYFIAKGNLDKSIFLVLGGWASVFYLLLHIISYNSERMLAGSVLPVIADLKIKGFSSNLLNKVGFTLNTATGIVTPVLLLAAIFKLLGIFVALWALMNTVAFAFLLLHILRKGRAIEVERSQQGE